MYDIKDLVWEEHKNAERQEFVKIMMSGKIHPKFFATYLWNLHTRYDLLEAMCRVHGLFDDFPEVQRYKAIRDDFNHLWQEADPPPTLPSTNDYVMHLKSCMNYPEKLMAHVYTLHMGDLSGGQMIKDKVPGSGKMYQFADMNHSVEEMKELIRRRTHDGMADEANKAFDFAIKIFEQLNDLSY